jgi:hypothetical protein
MARRKVRFPFYRDALGRAFAIICCLIVIALVILLFALLPGEGQEKRQLYLGIPLDEHLLELDKRSLMEAYHAQILKLWGVWLSDGAAHPERFTNGLRIARHAYGQAAEQIERREREIRERK